VRRPPQKGAALQKKFLLPLDPASSLLELPGDVPYRCHGTTEMNLVRMFYRIQVQLPILHCYSHVLRTAANVQKFRIRIILQLPSRSPSIAAGTVPADRQNGT